MDAEKVDFEAAKATHTAQVSGLMVQALAREVDSISKGDVVLPMVLEGPMPPWARAVDMD